MSCSLAGQAQLASMPSGGGGGGGGGAAAPSGGADTGSKSTFSFAFYSTARLKRCKIGYHFCVDFNPFFAELDPARREQCPVRGKMLTFGHPLTL